MRRNELTAYGNINMEHTRPAGRSDSREDEKKNTTTQGGNRTRLGPRFPASSAADAQPLKTQKQKQKKKGRMRAEVKDGREANRSGAACCSGEWRCVSFTLSPQIREGGS